VDYEGNASLVHHLLPKIDCHFIVVSSLTCGTLLHFFTCRRFQGMLWNLQ